MQSRASGRTYVEQVLSVEWALHEVVLWRVREEHAHVLVVVGHLLDLLRGELLEVGHLDDPDLLVREAL